MMMLDECVGHMTEKVVIPEADQIDDHAAALHPAAARGVPPVRARRRTWSPTWCKAGDGYRFHVTGLTHDERGYPSMNVETQDHLVRRLQDKLKPLADGRALFEAEDLDDAEVVVVSYGITSRVAQRAIQMARAAGRARRQVPPHLGLAVPGASTSANSPARVKAFVVPELNLGQMVHEVERAAAGRAKVIPVPPRGRHACTIPKTF